VSGPLVAGLDFGGSSLKAWIAELATGAVRAAITEDTATDRPRPYAAEFSPGAWWAAAGTAMRAAVALAGASPADFAGVTAASLRQGFVLVDGDRELGPGVLNSDRRGRDHLHRLRAEVGVEALYALTGHWPAPELTLPKLLDVQARQPELWQSAQTMLFVHDWALWRMSGARTTEISYACAGQMADVGRRTWAVDLLEGLGLGTGRLAPVVESATVVGTLADDSLGLPLGIPVVAAGGDAQVASLGVGGLADATATVVAGSTTPLLAAVKGFPTDPERHPWVSTHLRDDLWAAETNAGYTGMNFGWLAATTGHSVAELAALADTSVPGARGITATIASPVWSEEVWARKPPSTVAGFTMAHGLADLARAFVEAHAYGVRANLEDLERAVGTPFERVLVTGGAARSMQFRQLLADVCGRTLTVPEVADAAAAGGTAIVAGALGAGHEPTNPAPVEALPHPDDAYEEGHRRYLAVYASLLDHLPPEAYGSG
jgi:sugar (pentulose or hexulose) kinase